jgi:hypothetical protein
MKTRSEIDFVRQQFVDAWKKLSPLYRRHLADDPSKTLLNYLAFFTASDALVTLDRIGPTLGIEISRNGLIRLLGMISEGKIPPLAYLPDVVPGLRQILGLGPPLAVTPPDPEDARRAPALGNQIIGLGRLLADALISEARAHTPVPEERIRPWIVPQGKTGPYIEKIRRLLTEIVEQVLESSKLSGEHHDLYRHLVPATAWQESCFRQFEKKNGKVSYLVSYNGTSVGIMQINERVWRGIYDLRKLRWDIRYNTKAGCEILDIYFNRYVLKKIQDQTISKALDREALARVLYAMYNGGPGQFKRFLKRHASGKYYLSDRLFFEKFKWVKERQWEKIRGCL